MKQVLIQKVAEDNIINISEKNSGFKVSGTGIADSEIIVSFGTITRKVILGKMKQIWKLILI